MDLIEGFTGAGAVMWLVAGLVLIGFEIVLPGAYLLWFGLAAVATGAISFAAPLLGTEIPLAGQLVVFAVLAGVAVYEGRRRFSQDGDSDDPTLNSGAARLIGSRHALEKPIAGGRGRLKIGDSWWSVDGPDLPAGTSVEVIGVTGTRLEVAPVD